MKVGLIYNPGNSLRYPWLVYLERWVFTNSEAQPDKKCLTSHDYSLVKRFATWRDGFARIHTGDKT